MIKIYMSHGQPLIWNFEDWLKLRNEHRILGYFDGISDQISNKSLPIKLSTTEAQFIVKNKIGIALEPPPEFSNFNLPPTTVEKYQKVKGEKMKEIHTILREAKREFLESIADKIIESKSKKQRTEKSEVPPLDKNSFIEEELSKIKYMDTQYIQHKDPFLSTDDYMESSGPPLLTHLDKLKLKVFEDFHASGTYFLSSATKFGGDFLAYPGDPRNFHAEFIILCQNSNRILPKIYLKALQRLAQTVKKTLLIATMGPDGILTYKKIDIDSFEEND